MEALFGQFTLEIALPIITFAGVWIVVTLVSLIKGKIKRGYADRAVRFVEDAFVDIKGSEKYNEAANWIVERLAKWHIKVTEDEVKGLVESALIRMKQEYEKQW
ncbi:phage holin, LLH family [Brevibacillus porteri]|uniref:phage holin, LLH family n=1 Tax=Brevibacillus porteri TaxID=2126350 RepID=UPI0036376EB3